MIINNSRISIIIPYFGRFPEWIELYFYSCKRNEFIDWHFFTDCVDSDSKDKNLYFNKISFENYCKKISEKLQINFNPKQAYKLCDLRPFYGYIHADLLMKYDFWGFADLDTVWGDIKSFYSEKKLEKYNVFSTSGDRISGHLCLLRNNQKYRNLCFQIKDWQLKLKDERSFALDEIDFSYLVIPESKLMLFIYKLFRKKIFNWRNAWVTYYRIQPIVRILFFTKLRKLYFKEQHTTPILSDDGLTTKHDSDTWYYIDGKVINGKNKKEYIYCHFQLFKKNSFYSYYFWKDNYYQIPKDYNYSNGVKISKAGIEVVNHKITI